MFRPYDSLKPIVKGNSLINKISFLYNNILKTRITTE
jgi:hypothetical protein